MFDKTNASESGDLSPSNEVEAHVEKQWLPVHEGNYGHQFDHRFGTFDGKSVRAVTSQEHKNPDFEPVYELRAKCEAYNEYSRRWSLRPSQSALLGFRRVARSTDDRTSIVAVLPMMPLTYGWIVVLNPTAEAQAVLCSNLNTLVLDYCLRNVLSQPSIPQNVYEQLPVLPPSAYSPTDQGFIVSRARELTYTSQSMAPFARDLGYDGPPFAWDEDRRANLRAELDAWYALAYGLARDELRYVLAPKEVMGPDYPSETFRVLQKNEIARYGEYRTARLVMAAYDQLVSEGMRPRTEGYL
jgi:hypothetical protein